MKTPVLFLIYNRQDLTKRLIDLLREVKPTNLYVAADGPKNNQDRKLCRATRELIKTVDWDCKIHRLYRRKNLGCGKAVSSAISWFFDYVESGVILEDDCLVDVSFFQFAPMLRG